MSKKIVFYLFPCLVWAKGAPSLSNTVLAVDVAATKLHSAPLNNHFTLGYSTFDYMPNAPLWAVTYGGAIGRRVINTDRYELQMDVSFHQTQWDLSGTLSQGVDYPYPQFGYSYMLRNRQLLIETKLLQKFTPIIYPYLAVGLGTAWNQMSGYNTTIPAWLTVTPMYTPSTSFAFSYSLSAGADFNIAPKTRVGVSYYFSDLGSVSWGQGSIRALKFNGHFTQNNLYSNSILVRATYIC